MKALRYIICLIFWFFHDYSYLHLAQAILVAENKAILQLLAAEVRKQGGVREKFLSQLSELRDKYTQEQLLLLDKTQPGVVARISDHLDKARKSLGLADLSDRED